MNLIEEFQQMATEAFERGMIVRTSIEASSDFPKPRFRVSISEPGTVLTPDTIAWGAGPNPRDAINACKSKRAQANADAIEAARMLLKANGEL